MDFLVKVDDSLAPSFLELMRNLRRVKIERISTEKKNGRTLKNGRITKQNPEKEAILQGLKDAMEEVKLARAGKIKLKSANELLREL